MTGQKRIARNKYMRAYRAINNETVRRIQRNAYHRNKHKYKEKRRVAAREWYSRTRKHRLAQKKSYAKNNPDKIFIHNKRARARRRGAEGFFTTEDVKNMYIKQRRKCAICGIRKDKLDVDHIMPLALGGSNWPSNLQLLCRICNVRKGAKHPNDLG